MIIELCLLMLAANPWISIHHYQNLRHPYQKTYINLVTENTPADLTHLVYGFMPHWRGSFTPEINTDYLTHLAWFGIELDSGGGIQDSHGWPDDWDKLKRDVQGTGTRFDLAVTCFDWTGNKVHELLSIPENRTRAIETILTQSQGCDGVNIDFERPESADKVLFADFIRELADSLHTQGMEITVDVTAVNWGERLDAEAIASAADYLFIMGYDYHYSRSSQSGPVAPLEGETYNVTKSVDYYIEKTENRADKIILGVPYYGYDWPTETKEPYSETEGTGTAYIYSSALSAGEVYGIEWHEETSTPWYFYREEDGFRQCWFDDTMSLALKYRLVKNRDLAGTGIWALTYDAGKNELWELIAEHFVTGDVEEKVIVKDTLDVAGISTRWKMKRFLRRNPEYELYDIGGRILKKPERGVVFLKGCGTVKKVILIR
ncbi:hypothetical protein GF359_08985 [candidate division WOR-3 bacterium]|uniref:GH18 domain-containing protein n=1 Tax=candidate division WOR-3 bacterium TaxID=2052148 RepID=A0A9D5KAT6_UNCW3|nr:hypothetical protein [candidate division WOR-3 bacterium]MBD3365334.1 hypothetical protein [candidate division WOR-3 bacterium]